MIFTVRKNLGANIWAAIKLLDLDENTAPMIKILELCVFANMAIAMHIRWYSINSRNWNLWDKTRSQYIADYHVDRYGRNQTKVNVDVQKKAQCFVQENTKQGSVWEFETKFTVKWESSS